MDVNANKPPAFGKDVVYKECRHNTAASIGGNAQDGCLAFLKAGEDGTREALLCAACGCHRSFHRKVFRLKPVPVPQNQTSLNVVLALPATNKRAARVHSDLNMEETEMMQPEKRKRTRFSAEQKSRMIAFAESYDWKVYRRAGKLEVKRFCMEIGVDPHNFKMWLGNQRRPLKGKNAIKRGAIAATGTVSTPII